MGARLAEQGEAGGNPGWIVNGLCGSCFRHRAQTPKPHRLESREALAFVRDGGKLNRVRKVKGLCRAHLESHTVACPVLGKALHE